MKTKGNKISENEKRNTIIKFILIMLIIVLIILEIQKQNEEGPIDAVTQEYSQEKIDTIYCSNLEIALSI